MYRLTEAVKHLLIINVLMFVGSNLVLGEGIPYADTLGEQGVRALMMFPFESEFFRPYQIITHFFMHGSPSHLFFNMFALFMFGPPLETYWGTKKFVFYYISTAIGAMMLYWLVHYLEIQITGIQPSFDVPIVGASGAIFGLLTAYGMIFPNNVIQLIIPPIPLKAKYFVIILAAIELYLGLSGQQTGVAHFAHLGGALFGFLMIMYWRKSQGRW